MFNIFNSKKKKLEEEREEYIKARKMALDYIKKIKEQKEIELGDGKMHPIESVIPYLVYNGKNDKGNHLFDIKIEMKHSEGEGKMTQEEINENILTSQGEFVFSEEYNTNIADVYVVKYYKDFDNNINEDEAHRGLNNLLNKVKPNDDGERVIMLDYIGETEDNGLKLYHFICGIGKYSMFEKRSRRISEDVKNAVWRRDGGCCIGCGSNVDLEYDHIIPFSKGGANTYGNIQLLCRVCNRTKSNKIG